MQAIVRERYGSDEVLRFADVSEPVPGEGEVLVKVRTTSINTADLDQLRGRPLISRLMLGLTKPRSPGLGLDVVGEVVEVGPDVTTLQAGDRVWGDVFGHAGAFAEYVSAPARILSQLPEGLDMATAATVPHSAVLALQALDGKGRIRPGSRVLINGAGGCVGPFAIQLAKAFGAEVTGVDHTEKLAFMRRAGADHVVDYTQTDVTRSAQRYDLVVDIAATRSVLRFRRVLRRGGAYVLVAATIGGFVQAATVGALISVLGSRRMGVFGWTPSKGEDLATLGRMLIEGTLIPIVDRTYPLESVPDALAYLASGRARGKLLVEV
jgi:NADPH:quinone reductase-like Zn-dependent oxidoreductase